MFGKLTMLSSLAASTALAVTITGTAATAAPPPLSRQRIVATPGPCRLLVRCDQPIDTSSAADVVRAYYRAVDAKDYRTAYAKWSNGGAATGVSYAQFTRGFSQTRSTSVDVFNISQPEGGAGSQFVSVAVSVDATLKNGNRQRFAGTYTLRRINGVTGSTAEQRQWHIQSADLRRARR